jgi:hypothetical protein
MSPETVLAMFKAADEAFDLAGKLINWAQQRPELNTAPLPDEGAAMDTARDEAVRRVRRRPGR